MTPSRKKEIVGWLELRLPTPGFPHMPGEMLHDAMLALEQAENQVAALGRENQKLKDELTELQLMAVRSSEVRFGPTGSEEAATPKPRGRKWRR